MGGPSGGSPGGSTGSGSFGNSSAGSSASSFGSSNSSLSSGFNLASGFNLGTGSTTGTGTTRRGGSTTQVGSSSFLGGYYSNPLAMGMYSGTTANSPYGSGQSSTAFGQALYNLQTTTTGTTGTGRTGATNTFGRTGVGATGTATISGSNSFAGMGQGYAGRRPTVYAIGSVYSNGTRLARPRVAAPELRGNVQSAVSRSSRLSNPSGIRVEMDGNTVVLKGRVADPEEKAFVESLVRTERGVDAVRNELVPNRTTAAE
jgi:hypothetical protein